MLTPPQLEIYDNEGFTDCLKARWDFPAEWIRRHDTNNKPKASIWLLDFPTCGRCGKTIVTGARHCGECRRILGLPDDENQIPIVRCFNYGKELDRECRVDLPIDQARRPPDGNLWCGPCLMKVANMPEDWRQEFGYGF